MHDRISRTDYENIRLDRTGQAEAFDAIGDRYDEAFPYKEGQRAAGRSLTDALPAGARNHAVVKAAGSEIAQETSYTYAPEASDVPPEEQIFPTCRRSD